MTLSWYSTVTYFFSCCSTMVHETVVLKFKRVLDPHRKYIFLFLDTALLWCMGRRKHSIGTRPPTDFFFLVTELLWCIKLRINSIGTGPSKRKKIFSFLFKVLHVAWELDKRNWFWILATELLRCIHRKNFDLYAIKANLRIGAPKLGSLYF